MSDRVQEKTSSVVETIKKFITPLDEGHDRKFRIVADNEEIFPRSLHIEEADGGFVFAYGKRPEKGWQGILYREPEGGGSVTVPWVQSDNGILVGMLKEDRPNMGKRPVYCAMGGMIDPNEAREEARLREDSEESGLQTHGAEKLPGLGIVQDRLFYIADVANGEGVHCYSKEYSKDILEPAGENIWQPKKDVINHKKGNDLYFLPLREAALQTGDSLMTAALLQLVVKLGMV